MEQKETTARLTIREWSKDERPRERLVAQGPRALSDAELLAILIRTGTTSRSALDLSRDVLSTVRNDLAQLGHLGVHDLMRTKGLGQAKAVAIVAALELGRRRRGTAGSPERALVRSSSEAYEILLPRLADLNNEEFWLLLLDRGNRMIAQVRVSEGGLHGTVVDPKRIFKEAIDHKASGVVLSHNHPSGQLRPSEEDIRLTRNLVEAGRLLEIVVQDHLIIAGNGYFSFADQGML